jgi:hypothetical protein
VIARKRTRLRVRVHRTALCRVIVPRDPLPRTRMDSVLWHHGGFLVAGTPGDLFRLGALFRLAAVSPHSVVYLPLPHGKHQIVLMRQGVSLRPSAWPRLRAMVGGGEAATMQAPAPRPPRRPPGWDDAQVKVREHAGTVFMIGNAPGLFDVGDELTKCADEAQLHRDFRRFGEALVTQLDGLGEVNRRDDSWEIWVMARSRRCRGEWPSAQ